MSGTYRTPWWLHGAHAQTIYPASTMPLPEVDYQREIWSTPDGDEIALDWLVEHQAATPRSSPLLVLFHGLEGSSNSHYAKRIMAAADQHGWRGVVVHFRGCGGSPNLLPRSYHCGDSAEIDWILRRFRQQEECAIHVIGVSLGGNVLLKWLGEQGNAVRGLIASAAAVSTSLDLPATGKVLGQGLNRFYSHLFLKTLRPKAVAMIRRHKLDFDAERIMRADNLWDYDTLFTAPLHGFRDADDYWQQANCRPFLRKITLPTLLINARNDPFLPEHYLPTPQEISEQVYCEFTAHGGHAGFAIQRSQDWLSERLLGFFSQNR